MEFEISTKRRMENFIKSRISAVVLYVLYGGICELYQLDGRVRDEIDLLSGLFRKRAAPVFSKKSESAAKTESADPAFL